MESITCSVILENFDTRDIKEVKDMENITCGVILENDDFSTIQCNTTTGECWFTDDFGVDRLISGVIVENPQRIDVRELTTDIETGEYGECIGAIFDGDVIIKLLSDTAATIVDSENREEVDDTFEVDIYCDYEGEVDDG